MKKKTMPNVMDLMADLLRENEVTKELLERRKHVTADNFDQMERDVIENAERMKVLKEKLYALQSAVTAANKAAEPGARKRRH